MLGDNSSVRDVVNRQRVLGHDVKRAFDRQMADVARELAKERQRSSAAAGGGRAPMSLVSSARISIEGDVRGGKESFQRFVGAHLASLEMCRQRRAQDEDDQALPTKPKSKPDLWKRLTTKGLKRITQSTWRQHRFNVSTYLIARGGPRESSAAIPGRCGRSTGHAQNQRPPGSTRSKTGVSAIMRDGASVSVLECIYPESFAVFTGSGKVQHNMEAHLQGLAASTRSSASVPGVALMGSMSASRSSPNTWGFLVCLRINKAAFEVAHVVSGLAEAAEALTRAGNAPGALVGDLRAKLQGDLSLLPKAATEMGATAGAAPEVLRPLTVTFAIRQAKHARNANSSAGGWSMTFLCAAKCAADRQSGFTGCKTHISKHKECGPSGMDI
eukprot:g4300.t1